MRQVSGSKGAAHQSMRKLLPWYATGKLDGEDMARLEAHLAECGECREELLSEQALGRQVADLSIDVERGWAALRQRIGDDGAPSRKPDGRPTNRRSWTLHWLVGMQAAAILVLGLVIIGPQFDKGPQYRALSAPATATAHTGNMIVVFRPETPESDLRGMLRENGARLVDGPTSSDAYVLQVADGLRDAALAKLRADAKVVIAEPIDAGTRP